MSASRLPLAPACPCRPPTTGDVVSGVYSIPDAPHAVATDEVLRALGTDANAGLSAAAATGRLAQHGRNELAHATSEPWWRRLARQFGDLLRRAIRPARRK